MANDHLLFLEGFDHLDVPSMIRKWDVFPSNFQLVTGYSSTLGIQSTLETYVGPWLLKRLAPATPDKGVLAYRSSTSGLPYGGSTMELSIWLGGTRQFTLVINADGTGTIKRGDFFGTALGTTSVPLIANSTFKHLELAWTIHNSLGEIEIRSDGVTVLALSTVNLQNAGAAQWDGIELVPGTVEVFDDVVMGDQRNGRVFVGKGAHIRTLRPVANEVAEWLPAVGSSVNFENVDDTTPDGFASYNRGSFLDIQDLYQLETLSAAYKRVLGTQANALARKGSSGSTATIAHTVRFDGLDYPLAPQALTAGTTPRDYRGLRAAHPLTGAELTVDDINSGRWGYRRAT